MEDEIPEVPGSDVPQGVLPRLIATLVNRRKQVKSLMKDKSAGQAKMLQVSRLQIAYWTHSLTSDSNKVGYQAKGAQADRQLHVRLFGFCRLSVLRQTVGCIDHFQRSRDSDANKRARGGAVSRCESLDRKSSRTADLV